MNCANSGNLGFEQEIDLGFERETMILAKSVLEASYSRDGMRCNQITRRVSGGMALFMGVGIMAGFLGDWIICRERTPIHSVRRGQLPSSLIPTNHPSSYPLPTTTHLPPTVPPTSQESPSDSTSSPITSIPVRKISFPLRLSIR